MNLFIRVLNIPIFSPAFGPASLDPNIFGKKPLVPEFLIPKPFGMKIFVPAKKSKKL
jgi:hypothetical protein